MSDKYSQLYYWDAVFSRAEIAAVSGVTRDQVKKWKYSSVPFYARMLLRVYSGELSLGEWEDIVEDAVEEIKIKDRRVTKAQAKAAKQAVEKIAKRCEV